MEEDDEFGDLYSDLPPRDAHNSLPIAEFSEEDELPAAPARFAKLVDSPSNGFLVGGGDSDEDEQVLLLPGDEVSRKRNLPEDASSMPAHGTVGNFQKRFDESVATEGANRAVGKGASLLESSSAIAKGFEETLHTCTFTSSQILERSPAGEDLTNHAAATIPGLGTASNAVQFAPQDELYDEWGGGDAVGKVLKGDAAANLSGQDLDSESEDDLRIVLNDGHQFHQSFERGADGGMEERSEDEDGEDFVILAGGEAVADQEWGEEALLPIEGVQALAAEKVVPVGEEKQGDEKGQSGKMLQGVTRSVYGGRAYHSNHSQYRYVRPGALGGAGATSGAQGPNRVSLSKAGSGRGDWSGASRGFPPLPSWGNNASRGIQYGFEYTLPPNKTVYDIDLDTLDEKPWRHPSVDVSDYFNFGFNESSWKDYCQQLAQLRLESTMQSKIRVYESGRSEKEYDPDLPPELVAAAGIRGTSGEGAQHRQLGMVVMTTAAAGGGQGVGRGHLYHPIGRAIQVEGGVGERHPSADVRKQRIRDSDAIILVHATEDDLVKEQSSADNCQEEEVDAKIYQSLDLNDESDMLGKSAPALHSRVGVLKRGLLPSGLKSQGTSSRSRFSSEVDKASAGSKMQISESNAGHPVNLFPGESFSPYAVRHKILRTLLPRRIPIPEKRETDRAQSYSSSIHNESKPVQDSKNNKRSHMSSTVRKEKDEPSYSNERSTEDKTVIDVSRVHMQDEKHKFSGQDEFKQSDVIDTPLLSLKRQRRDSHNAARVMRQSNYARTNPSGESASAMNLGSDEERKKVILEHRAENMPHRRDHTMDEEGEHLYSEKAQSDQRSGSAGHRGEQVDKETFSDMVKLDEQNKKSKDRVKLNKVKKKMPGTHTRAADAQLRRKKKEDEIKSDYPLKEKRKGRGLLDRSDVKKRRKNGSKKDKVDSEKGVKEQHANRFLSTEDDLVFQRAEEGKYRKADNGNHQHVEKQKLGSKHYEKDATICERREEVSRRDKSEDYNHHKEREDTHQWRGFHNVKMERDDSRYVPAGSVGRISDDREVGAHSKDRAELRDSVQVFSADQECIRELHNYFEAQEWDSNHMEHCLESEAPAKYHLCEEDTFFQQHSKHQGKSSHGLSFDKRGQSYIEARSSDEQRHRSGRLCFDPCKGTNLRNKRKKTFSDLLDNSGQDPKNVDNDHANGNYRLNKHYQKALSSQSLNTIDVRWEQAEPVGGNGEVSLEVCRSQGNAFEARCLTAKESPHVSHSGLSQDEHHQRGRSKLERWASQKGIDDDASRVMAHNKKLTKKGRQRGKHYKTSSRQSQEIVPGSSDRQISSQIDHSVPEAKKGTECDLRRHMLEGVGGNELCRNWKDKGAVKEEDVAVINPDDSSLNAHVQQPLKMQQLELAAKLEKRKARFKLPMTEEKESARRLTLNNHHPPDPTEVKPERPARKRRWGSS